MMCAKLLHPSPRPSRVVLKRRRVFDNVIARYGVALNWVLDRQA
jgi:multidrug efflux pump